MEVHDPTSPPAIAQQFSITFVLRLKRTNLMLDLTDPPQTLTNLAWLRLPRSKNQVRLLAQIQDSHHIYQEYVPNYCIN